MQPAFDSRILDRMISQGRERGCLTTEDLRAGLPVDAMSAEEIALVVVQLEEAGIPVELEESLLSANPRAVPHLRQSAEIIPFPGPRADRKKPMAKPLQPVGPPRPELRPAAENSASFDRWIVVAAGGVAFAVFSLIIFAAAG